MTDDASPVVIEVGGQRFRFADFGRLSVEQDGWISAKLERAGANDPRLARLKPAARAEEIYLRVLESGQVGALLAGFLVEEGKTWDTDRARKTAKLLGGPADAGIRELLFATLRGAIAGFFGSGKDSDTATGRPSSTTDEEPTTPPESSAASSADSGSPSSAPSGVTTPSASEPASAGR